MRLLKTGLSLLSIALFAMFLTNCAKRDTVAGNTSEVDNAINADLTQPQRFGHTKNQTYIIIRRCVHGTEETKAV